VDRIALQLPGLQNSARGQKDSGKTATLGISHGRMRPTTPCGCGHRTRALGLESVLPPHKQPVLLKRDVVVTFDHSHRRDIPAEYPLWAGRVGRNLTAVGAAEMG